MRRLTRCRGVAAYLGAIGGPQIFAIFELDNRNNIDNSQLHRSGALYSAGGVLCTVLLADVCVQIMYRCEEITL